MGLGRGKTKNTKKLGGDRYVYYDDCDNGFTGVCVCPNSSITYIKYVQLGLSIIP
jgi:hypothetical protein